MKMVLFYEYGAFLCDGAFLCEGVVLYDDTFLCKGAFYMKMVICYTMVHFIVIVLFNVKGPGSLRTPLIIHAITPEGYTIALFSSTSSM